MAGIAADKQIVYWHHDLPPFEAFVLDEYAIDIDGVRVPGTRVLRDEVLEWCRADLQRRCVARLEREVQRLDGHYAHVFCERIDATRDEAKDETWLHGRFRFSVYR
jgi:hypothetical protein